MCEVRKENREEYPPNTLYEIVMALQMYLAKQGKLYKFLGDSEFLQLKNTLDNIMSERTKAGGKTKPRKADVITIEQEEKLWSSGVLGSENPKQLLYTLVYQFGLNFALRAGEEHRNLRFTNSQLEILTDVSGLQFLRYTEDVSKANQGGIAHKNVKGKVVDAYENPVKSRCVVSLYKKYLSRCPVTNRPDAFYLRPVEKSKLTWEYTDVWYVAQPIGKNKLGSIVKELCAQANLSGYFTNHSLRATAATRIFQSGMPEKLVCDTTGHRSTTAVREYQRNDESVKRSISSVVQGLQVENNKRICTEMCTPKIDGFSVKENDSTKFTFNVTINLEKK